MNSRTILIMGALAVAAAGAAFFTTRSSDARPSNAAQAGTALFPELAKQAASVQKVQVQAKGQTFTLEKHDGRWGMAEKGGYTVDFDKVKDLVSKLAYFQILERKTDRPERLGELDLEDAALPEAKSTRVTLSDASGAVLADLLLGKAASGGGPNLASMYVRRPSENQAWEVKGNVHVDGTASNWLDKQVLKVERARVHRVETVAGDGSKLVVSKTAPDDKNFAVQDLPAGAELKWPGVADGVAGALEYLNFEDVDSAGKLDFNDPATTTTTLQTFDGLLVTVKVLEKEGKFHAQFGARADPAARVEVTKFELPPPVGPEAKPADPAQPADPANPEATAADPAAPAEPPAPPQPVETKSVPGKTAEEVAKEASELDAKLSQWTYVIPGYTAANFTKKLSDMLKEVGPLVDPNAPPPVDDGALVPEIKQPEETGGELAPTPAPAPPSGGGGR